MDEIIRNMGPPLGVGLISLVGYLWARGVHGRARKRARREAHPAE
ncbi:MAG TPA: hypothetical protein VM899_05105 [Rubellimicrobium sp.]|nr:hypothetical protein [Rubellimicrobium sp.]